MTWFLTSASPAGTLSNLALLPGHDKVDESPWGARKMMPDKRRQLWFMSNQVADISNKRYRHVIISRSGKQWHIGVVNPCVWTSSWTMGQVPFVFLPSLFVHILLMEQQFWPVLSKETMCLILILASMIQCFIAGLGDWVPLPTSFRISLGPVGPDYFVSGPGASPCILLISRLWRMSVVRLDRSNAGTATIGWYTLVSALNL